MAPLLAARLPASDLLRLGGSGLRSRPLRAVLSALGIAIGIAAMVAVVGISSSSQANLERALAAMGTNMLSITPGDSLYGDEATLPDDALGMIKRIGPVTAAVLFGATVLCHLLPAAFAVLGAGVLVATRKPDRALDQAHFEALVGGKPWVSPDGKEAGK